MTEDAIDATDGHWNDMASAPRDGTPILISFGSDWRSSAVYVDDQDDPHPWKFIDLQDGKPIINGARDDQYGPTGWLPIPPWVRPLRKHGPGGLTGRPS